MPDKIRPLKIENLNDGSQNDMGFTTEADPAEDFISIKGIAFENSDDNLIEVVGNEITFTDTVSGSQTLSRLIQPLANTSATTDPSTSNDSTQNYEIGSVWVNTSTDTVFVCADATAGSAVWVSVVGAQITIEEDGVPVGSGTVSTLNFIGEGVTATDAGNGIVDIDIQTEFGRYVKNILVNTLEIATLKNSQLDPEFTYFVDSFESADQVDSLSTNFTVNETNGFVELTQSGSLQVVQTTEDQFNLGTTTDTEVIMPVSSDGALRKEQTVAGQVSVLEDFEDTSNVSGQNRTDIYVSDFEDGTLNGWTISVTGGGTGVATSGGGNIVSGGFGLEVEANGRLLSPVFDNTGLTNVRVRLFAAGKSLDTSNEQLLIGWFDGTAWQTILTVVNGQSGVFEISIPDSWLASNNQLVADLTNNATLFGGTNTNGDQGFIDDVEVFYLSETQLPQTSNGLIVFDGAFSGQYNVDFAGKGYNGIKIDLSSVDISSAEVLKLYLYKNGTGSYQYRIRITDSAEDVFETALQSFTTQFQWEAFEINVSAITGIDTTDVVSVEVEFVENTSAGTVFELSDPPSTASYTLVDDRTASQSFEATTSGTVGRIQLTFQTRNNQPRVPLFVALANIFDTTLATAQFVGSQTPVQTYGPFEPAIAVFDNPVSIVSGQTYKILLVTLEDSWSFAWQFQISNISYTDGVFIQDGNPVNNDLMFTLLPPIPDELVFFDNLEIEEVSTFAATGSFLSEEINFGIVPDALDDLSFTQVSGPDTVEIRFRVATTQAGLSSAVWSQWFIGPGPHNIGTFTPQQWFQYELRFTGGSTTGSTIIEQVVLDYSIVGGAGNANIISTVETAVAVPEKFIFVWEDSKGTGSINYFVSRSGKTTWQSVPEVNKGDVLSFTGPPGTAVHIRAVITGNAKLFSWGIACDQDFL